MKLFISCLHGSILFPCSVRPSMQGLILMEIHQWEVSSNLLSLALITELKWIS